jgi:hypothetical protein
MFLCSQQKPRPMDPSVSDHCGALPYMTEMVGYSGPIYMTR